MTFMDVQQLQDGCPLSFVRLTGVQLDAGRIAGGFAFAGSGYEVRVRAC